MCVEEELEDEFTCSICYFVLKNPKQCKECEGFVDEECLHKWWNVRTMGGLTGHIGGSNRGKCPLCKKSTGFTSMHRMVKSWLNSRRFKCPKCSKIFKYEDFHKHFESECEHSKEYSC